MLNRRAKSGRDGAAAVEFAISVAVLIMVVFASIEFARLTMLKHAVEHASYLGARKGIMVGSSGQDVRDTAVAHLDKFSLTSATVTVNPTSITDSTDVIEVTTTVPVSGNSWISPLYFGGDLSGRTRMLTERAAAKQNAAIHGTPPPPPPPGGDDDDDDD